jgi:hypothetical protein
VIAACNYGLQARGMCRRHTRQWDYAERPDLAAWQASPAPLPAPPSAPPACRIGYCGLWAQGTSAFCASHDDRWKARGRPDLESFIASHEDPGPGQEHIDLRRLPAQLRLEVQYVFAGFLAAQPASAGLLADVDRPLIERYLAGLSAEMGGRQCHFQHVGALNGFLRAIRQHGWDDTLPASAMIFSEEAAADAS